jgi:HEAT repeat protein
MRLAFAFSLLAIAQVAQAGPASEAKALSRRQEAADLVLALARGQGNPQTHISRLQFLGEQKYAAVQISARMELEGEVRLRRTYAMALAQIAHRAGAEQLGKALDDEDGAVRMYAAQGLGRMGAREELKKLIALLSDRTLGVRREVAIALGTLADVRAGAPLMDAARREGEVEVRSVMLAMVGRTGDKKQMAALDEFLTSSSEGTRFGAAQGLCALGSPKGYDYARKLLASKDRSERLQGLKLFEGSKARAAAPVLAPLLTDGDPAVAAVAARVLYQGGDAQKLDWLVLRSYRTTSLDERMYFEKELETLRLGDDQRKAILLKAGIQ